MSTYLLLRDNKQSGPYSTEELIAKGLKPYDLVWLEGKSAAWRYPSEIPELKTHAATVEEQPHDRFYRKAHEPKATGKEEAVAALALAAEEAHHNGESVPSASIHVTLPSSIENCQNKPLVLTDPPTPEEQAQQTAPHPENLEQAVKTALVIEKIAESANRRIDSDAGSIATLTQYYEQQYAEKAKELDITRKRSFLMPAIIGICLLLGGVVIGLAISTTVNKIDKGNLEQVVQAITQRQQQQKKKKVVKAKTTETTTAKTPKSLLSTSTPNTVVLPPAVLAARAFHTKDTAVTASNIIKPVTITNPPTIVQKDSINKVRPLTSIRKKDSAHSVNNSPVVVRNEIPATSPVIDKKEDHLPPSPVIQEEPKETKEAEENKPTVTKVQLQKQVSVNGSSFKTAVLGGISGLQLTVTNNSRYSLDEVVVEVKYFDPDKNVVKTQSVYFNEIPPGESKTIEAPRTNRGVSVEYSISNVHSKAIDNPKNGL